MKKAVAVLIVLVIVVIIACLAVFVFSPMHYDRFFLSPVENKLCLGIEGKSHYSVIKCISSESLSVYYETSGFVDGNEQVFTLLETYYNNLGVSISCGVDDSNCPANEFTSSCSGVCHTD